MPPKTASITDELINALRDPRVLDALAGVFETRLQPLLDSIQELKTDNERKSAQITKLQGELQSADARLNALESYTRRDNLLITGLPVETFAEAAAVSAGTNATEPESSWAVEQSVLKLFNDKLGVPIKSCDISVAHRLKKRSRTDARPPVTIVRFTNRKAREAVYGARRQLKPKDGAVPTTSVQPAIFINEDLTQATAELFHQARQLVRQKVIHSTWTSSCAVYIRDTGEPSCRPRKISSAGELPRAPSG
jgi:hypothetical protein